MNKTKLKNNVVSETYESLRDYMIKNGYSAVAMLDKPSHTNSNEELYGTEMSNVNYNLNIINL